MKTKMTCLGMTAAAILLVFSGQANATYTFTDLGTLGGDYSFAYAINNAGHVVGVASTAGNSAYHASFWNGSTAIDLGTLGGTHSYATAINDSGQVVGGSYIMGDTAVHATVWNGGTVIDLGAQGGG